MVKLVKIVDNKYVQIEEYKNPNICFNTNEYSDFEDYCTLRETFDPFEIFYENQELKSQLKGTTYCFDEEEHEKLKKQLEEKENIACDWKDSCLENAGKIEILETQQKEFTKFLEGEIKELQKIKETELDYDILKDVMPQLLVFEDVLQKHKSIIGDDK